MSMRSLTTSAALLAAATSALPQSLTDDSTKLEHPVFISPRTIPLETFGAPPEVIHINNAELMTDVAVISLPPVPGSKADGIPISALQDRALKDGRYHQTQKGYPWDYIGTVVSSTGVHCTGSLVGPRHVATARHCVNMPGEAQASYTFSPHYDQGTNGYVTSSVQKVLYLPGESDLNGCSLSDDWAILILDERLGDKYGWFGLIPFSEYKSGRPIFSNLGYPSDLGKTEVPYQQDGVSAFRSRDCNSFQDGAPIATDMRLAKGHSGGPLWFRNDIGQNWLYGVASASSDTDSVFAGGKAFILKIQQLRQEYP